MESDDEYFERLEKNEQKVEPVKVDAKMKGISQMKLQSLLMQLRKVCNHPFLFDLHHEQVLPSSTNGGGDINASNYNAMETATDSSAEHENFLTEYERKNILTSSGKMMVLDRLLSELLKRGHKVLVFSQMTKMLDIVADYCFGVKGWRVARIDGNVKIDERKLQIEEFNNDPEMKIFLLSTRAGGLGINLTAADTVIIFDSDWNPQMDLQAQDRVHRIGQTKPVVVFRFISANSVESKILEKANAKRKLEKLVIHKGEFKGSQKYYESKSLCSTDDLAQILATEEFEAIQNNREMEKDEWTTENVLSDAEVERLMDRSEENMVGKKNYLDGGEGVQQNVMVVDDSEE
ncbi:hypothetical protein HK098_001458 [Nowakowskiella sp. JEL0407]|nr:hypothetical protein HK098_001458 [Nowakowskiella sp. JEL0407]